MWKMLTALMITLSAQAAGALDIGDARNFVTLASGRVVALDDPRVLEAQRQLELIERACARTSSGAGIHDKIAKTHSLADSGVSLSVMLADFTKVAAAQCGRFDDTTLLALYGLETSRGGKSHAAAIAAVRSNPRALVEKWSRRSP